MQAQNTPWPLMAGASDHVLAGLREKQKDEWRKPNTVWMRKFSHSIEKFHPKWRLRKYINSQLRPADSRNPAPPSHIH